MTEYVRQTVVATMMVVVVTSGLVSACASGRQNEIVKDTLLGAGGGAIVGAVVPGVSIGTGAAIGAAGGAIVGVLKDKKGHTIYSDERGNKYWLDGEGRRHYQ